MNREPYTFDQVPCTAVYIQTQTKVVVELVRLNGCLMDTMPRVAFDLRVSGMSMSSTRIRLSSLIIPTPCRTINLVDQAGAIGGLHRSVSEILLSKKH